MKKGICVAVLLTAALLTGCTSVPDLDNVNRDLEAEYMAGILLKYDKNNQDMLDYDRSILTPTPTPVPTRTPAASPSATGQGDVSQAAQGEDGAPAVDLVDADEILSKGGIHVGLQTYELKKSYGTDFATLDAHDGNRLLIVKFQVRNTAGSGKRVNMTGRELSYSLEVDGVSVGSPLQTILDNDLQFMKGKIDKGASKEAVLVFETEKSLKLQNAELAITEGNKTAKVPLR